MKRNSFEQKQNSSGDNEQSKFEPAIYWGILSLLAILYVYFSYFSESNWFGFNQLRHLSPAVTVGLAVFAGAVWVGRAMVFRQWIELNAILSRFSGAQRFWLLLTLSLACGLLFFSLSNNFINPDGMQVESKIIHDVPVKGAHLTHDEILELFIHSRFWYYTNQLFGWSVAYSYQVLSSIGAVFFIFILVKYGMSLGRDQGGLIVAGVAACGFMQLFFGDVENYTLVSVLILAYLYIGHLYLNRRCSLIVPSAVLALAMMFHLLAGWLLPSLAYLYWISIRRQEFKALVTGFVSMLIITIGTIFYFHFNGLPFGELYYNSHAFGQGGHIEKQLIDFTWSYFGQVVSLLFLLVPPVLLIIPMILFGRLRFKSETVFLSIASVFMLLFMFTWKAMLGVYNDWNLFAPATIPLSVLLWYSMSQAKLLPRRNLIAYIALVMSAWHSYSWIVSNHYYHP